MSSSSSNSHLLSNIKAAQIRCALIRHFIGASWHGLHAVFLCSLAVGSWLSALALVSWPLNVGHWRSTNHNCLQWCLGLVNSRPQLKRSQ